MPRFHFNMHDGRGLLDGEGADLPDVMAARQVAIRLAGGLIGDGAAADRFGDQDWWMDVADDEGRVLFRLYFTVIQSTVVGSEGP